MPSSLLLAVNSDGRVFGLSTKNNRWREFVYLGLEFKHLSAVPHFLWAVGGDRQIYLHVHGLDIPIRIKEEAYENERWIPLEGFGDRLLPTDRFHFSSEDGTRDRAHAKIRLPSMAWQWEGEWHLDTTLDGQPLDHDGWTYAVDFPATYHPNKQWKSCVRRRKWIRYRRYSALNSWCAIAPLHKDATQEPFIDVSVGGQGVPGGNPGHMLVWAITAQGRVMFRTGVSTTSPEGARWTAVPIPPSCEVKQISVGPTGLVWAVLWNGRALVRAGVTRDSPTGDGWLEVAAPQEGLKLAQVSVGTNAVWCTTSDHRVWFRKGVRGESSGTSEELARGSGWVEMVGNMANVSVATNDQVWAVSHDDRCIYFRTGVLPTELTGRKWRPIHAPAQLSRTSSNASLVSVSRRNGRGGSCRDNRVKSWCSPGRGSSVSTESRSLPRDVEETSRSAPTPTSLRLQSSLWQRTSDGTSRMTVLSGSEESISERDNSNENLNAVAISNIEEHCERAKVPQVLTAGKGEVTKKNPIAWSPVRSAGSVVGMELHAESEVFDAEGSGGDSGVFGEDDDPAADMYWDEGDNSWCMVEAGACVVDPLYPPNWFRESLAPEAELSKPWRLKILEELKRRIPKESAFEKYENAVEMASWVKTGKARCMLKDITPTSQFEDCIVELEWVGSDQGSLDSGTLTILSPDRTNTKSQFSLSEITCVICCSEPSKPRIAIHTPKLTKSSSPLQLQFNGDTDMEDWMANLTLVCCLMYGIHGAPSPGSMWITTVLGDVFVFDPATFESNQMCGEIYTQDLDVAGKSTPFQIPLHNSFPRGTILTIRGCVLDTPDRFVFNLKCENKTTKSDSSDIAFHFNPRFKKTNAIVRNSYRDAAWGEEEREGNNVFRPGLEFTVTIECEHDGYKISIDGTLFTYYEHRQKPCNVTHIEIKGDVLISKVVYQSKMVIIPPAEMFWRQMGGHLRRVETCAAGVTWGVGFNNTAWVYTGGWGGSFLRGVETSRSGIHPMSDTHNCYVYENQRWNPLTGYTAHGLPTDRYMWSDVTGRHKRTREKTKLMSMHWQWVSQWEVDYYTPGGVDKEGWQYAMDFPATYRGQKHFTDYVRRRRWVRRCQLTTSGPWQELGNTRLVDVALYAGGTDDPDSAIGVWAVAANGDAVYRRGVSKSCPTGTSWEHVPSDQPLASISCGADNQVWAVGRNGSAYWRFGITASNNTGTVWQAVEPPAGKALKQICVGRGGVWGLDAQAQLSVRRGVTPVFPEGTHWQTLPADTSGPSPGFRSVTAGVSQGEVWAITGAGVVCRRHGITDHNPAGSEWTQGIEGNWQHVSARGASLKSFPSH